MIHRDDTGIVASRFTEPLPLFDTIEAPEPIPDPIPHFTEPAEQHAAETRHNQRKEVLEHFIKRGNYGSTDYETGLDLKILRTSAGKRRKELCQDGMIVDSGTRRKTDTGSTAIVWRINA